VIYFAAMLAMLGFTSTLVRAVDLSGSINASLTGGATLPQIQDSPSKASTVGFSTSSLSDSDYKSGGGAFFTGGYNVAFTQVSLDPRSKYSSGFICHGAGITSQKGRVQNQPF
jgi:hypothetical protein